MKDLITSKLSTFGAFLAVVGIGSIILNFFNYNLRILKWIDLWGDTMGWVIRIGLVVVGGILLLVFRGSDEEETAEE